MGILRKMNFQRHMNTLRTLDYENVDAKAVGEGRASSGRLSDSLYEGTSRVPRSAEAEDESLPEDAPHLPVTGERPDPRAQWDDVRGCWVVWDTEQNDWTPITAESSD